MKEPPSSFLETDKTPRSILTFLQTAVHAVPPPQQDPDFGHETFGALRTSTGGTLDRDDTVCL
jgi:hypothetical protein